MRIEFTRVDLLVYFANHYTTQGAQIKATGLRVNQSYNCLQRIISHQETHNYVQRSDYFNNNSFVNSNKCIECIDFR